MRLYLTLILYSLLGVAYAATDTLYLIPQPKKVEIQKGRFVYYSLNPDTLISKVISNTTKEILPLYVHSKMSINWAIAKEIALGEEGYRLRVTPTKVMVTANTHAGLFYGTQTLAQLIKANSYENSIPCVTITDIPGFKIRAWQDDISRGPIPTLAFLKEQVRTMASYKMNAFMLYMENVVKLSKHPNLAPPDALTIDELKELIAYAKQYHVTVIGNFQSYGHFEKTLRVPGYEHLGENAFTLSPAKEEAYQFLSDAYSELVPLFDYEYFHVNCDEVMLGNQGASKQLVDSLGESGVYSYHLNRVNDLLKPYHKKMMLWGDMVAKDSVAISKLPKDAMVVSWGYGPMEKRADDLKPLVKAGVDFMVAPGVSCWSRIYPDISRSIINIYHYLHDGYQYGAKGFINTTWDDDGQNLFNNNWYGLLWGAHLGWNVPRYENADSAIAHREEHVAAFNQAFNRLHFGTTYNVAGLMRSVGNLNYGPVKNCMSTAAYWQTPLTDKTFYAESWERDNLNLIHTLDSLQKYELQTAAKNVAHNLHQVQMLYMATAYSHALANTNLLNVQMRPYVSVVDTSYPLYIFNEEIANSFFDRGTLAKSYRHFWGFENRPVYADTVTGYFLAYRDRLMVLNGTCILQPGDTLINGMRPIRLKSAFDNLPVYYTLNGTEPTAQSTLYTQPIAINSNVRIKARVIDSLKAYDVVEDTLVFHRGIGKLYKLNTEWTPKNPAYAAGGKLALLDGRRGNPKDFSDGRWQGYLDKDINVELDMGTATALTKITMGFGQLQPYGIMLPAQIEVSVSSDGTNYTLVKTSTHDVPGTKEERVLRDFEIDLTGTTARYIKVVAKNYGALPKGHFAEGKPSWLFADEIIVE
jgi:hexosaminidase